jgi:hypothetical protein
MMTSVHPHKLNNIIMCMKHHGIGIADSKSSQPSRLLATNTMPPRLWIPNSVSKSANKYFTDRSTRKEALSLYREILRTCKAFHWKDEATGEAWSLRLKREARKEFEQSKEETDPLIIARMLVTGRDCVQQVQNKFNDADRAAWARIERDSSRRK